MNCYLKIDPHIFQLYANSFWHDIVSHNVSLLSILSMHLTVVSLYIAHVHSDGLGRTGTFIAIWSLIEQVKAEGQIDVVGTIKSIRTQRPGAVPHLVRASDIQAI